MSAYMIIMGTITDREGFQAYARRTSEIITALGADYVATGRPGDIECLEGHWPHQSLVISKWPSMEAARAFWTSPDYQEAKKLREGKGQFDVLIVPGNE